MNKISHSIFVGATIAMMLAGCQKKEAPAVTSKGEPSQTVTDAKPVPQVPTPDPSLPKDETVFGTRDAADKAKAMQDTTALQKEKAPQREMTKEEESKAMPLPGQGGDHSAINLDKSKRK